MAAGSSGSNIRLVVLSLLAEDDQLEAFDYTVKKWGHSQAVAYMEFLDETMLELARAPRRVSTVPNLRGVRCYLAKWPGAKYGHRVYFRETEYGIYVLRILHSARQLPDTWP